MKRTITSILAATALLLGITAPAANAGTWTYSNIEEDTTVSWSKSMYTPNDNTVTAVIRSPNIAKAVLVTLNDNGDYVPMPGTTTKKAKKEDGIPGYNITFKNPKKEEWMSAYIYLKGNNQPYLIEFDVPYMNSKPWVSVNNLGGATGETKKIIAWVSSTYPKMNYTIQLKTNGKWKTVKKYKNIKTPVTQQSEGIYQILSIKLPKKAGKYTYRITASNPYNNLKHTSNFKMKVMNQKRYASYLKKAKKYVKSYCPSTSVYINKGPYKFNSRAWAGMAYSSDLAFSLRPNMENSVLKYVSLHECAHILQYHANQFAPDKIAEKRLAKGPKVYKNKRSIQWTEIEADCMALIMQGIKSNPIQGYTSTCTAKQFKMAKSTLKTGLKYYKKVN